MGNCPSCGHSGQANKECADKSSQIIWDGGALCTGISFGTLNDVIREQSLRICAIASSISNLGVSSSSVSVMGQIGTCIPAATYLDEWITNMETYLCGLNTTVAALDPTAPVYFNNNAHVIPSAANFVTYDTVSIPGNTINGAYEYLQVEVWARVSAIQKNRSVVRVSYLGKDVDIFLSDPSTMPKPYYKNIKATINFRYSSLSTVMEYDYDCIAVWNGRELVNGSQGNVWSTIGAPVSPVNWAATSNLVVSAYNDGATITVSRLVITKFNID